MVPDYDVVVVGAGGAGLSAAIAAHDAGRSVLVVDGATAPGGSTAVASGSFLAAGTAVQAEAGIDADSPDELFRFWMLACQWQADPAIVRRFCDQAPATLSWLRDLGVAFRPENLRATPLAGFPRAHRPDGGGQAIVDTLVRGCRDRGIDVALGNKVDRLVTAGGRVVGVSARGESLGAGAVVLATGGFARNPAMLAEHFPDTAIGGDGLWSPAPETCQGEGIALAVAAGAATDGTNRGEMVLSNGLLREFEPYRPGWPMFVNGAGRRFVSEVAPNAVMLGVFKYQDGPVWAVFDHAACAGGLQQVDSMYAAPSWSIDAVERGVGSGQVVAAPSIADLAATIGAPVTTLAATVQRYNDHVAAGIDTDYLKPAGDLAPVVTAPFYAVRVRPMIVPVTGYGVRIDADARVQGTGGRPVDGLYAAGEVTGSVFGSQYVSHGQAVATAIVFGRIAGETSAAATAPDA